jgi:hypothetical protein
MVERSGLGSQDLKLRERNVSARPLRLIRLVACGLAVGGLAAAGLANAAAQRPARPPHGAPATLPAYEAAVKTQQDALAQADANYLSSLRAAFRGGGQAQGRAALVAYANGLVQLSANLPAPPSRGECLAQAAPAARKASTTLAAAISRRQLRIQALSAIKDRPLSLPDYAGVAADPAASQSDARQVQSALADARNVAERCEARARSAARARRTVTPAATSSPAAEP